MKGFLAGILAVCLLMVPQPVRADRFDAGGVRIHYVQAGAGEPVILIHGLTSSAADWGLAGTTALLARHYRVIALDCRGHGLSGKPTADDAYGVQMVEAVVRLLDHLKIERAHIVGYSMGGMIALKLAVMHPNRVRSVVLGGMGMLKEGSPLQHKWATMRGEYIPRVPQALLRGIAALAVTDDQVRAIKAPVTMLVGDRDPTRSLYVYPAHRLRPDWPVIIIPDAGHINCAGKESFQKAVLSSLGRQSSGNQSL